MKAIITKIMDLFKASPTMSVESRFNAVYILKGKRVFVPANTPCIYGIGITSNKKTWPKV
jgi:hypothetical protein